MLLAQRGLPSLRVFAVTLIGGTLAAAQRQHPQLLPGP